jgi:hypothetical protein
VKIRTVAKVIVVWVSKVFLAFGEDVLVEGVGAVGICCIRSGDGGGDWWRSVFTSGEVRTVTELVAGLPRLCHPRGIRAGIALDEAAEDGHLLVASAVSYRKTGLESQGKTSLI